MRIAGIVLTGFTALFLGFDAIVKVLVLPVATEPGAALGLPIELTLPLGLIELACLGLYLFPRTSVLGAVLLTGHLGGAIAIQLRAGNPPGMALFPLLVGAMVWGGLWLRDARVRALLAAADQPTERATVASGQAVAA